MGLPLDGGTSDKKGLVGIEELAAKLKRAEKLLDGLPCRRVIWEYGSIASQQDNFGFSLLNVARQTIEGNGDTPDDTSIERLAKVWVRELVAAYEAFGVRDWQALHVELFNEAAREFLGHKPKDDELAALHEPPETMAYFEARLQELAGANDASAELLPLDAKAAAWFERYGKEGKATANDLRTAARERWSQRETVDVWRLWRREAGVPVVRFAENLVRVLWMDVVKGKLETDVPMLALPVIDSLVSMSRPGLLASVSSAGSGGSRRLKRGSGSLVVPTDDGRFASLPSLDKDVVDAFTDRVVGVMGRTDTHRLFQHLAIKGHEESQWGGKVDRDDGSVPYVIEGGFEELARRLGYKTNKARTTLAESLEILKYIEAADAYGERSNLLHYYLNRGGPGVRSSLEITLFRPMTGTFAWRKGPKQRGLLLVPVPQGKPVLVGDPARHGAQWVFRLLMYRFFTEHSDALATNGGWELSTDTWKDLVGQAGLDVRDIPQRLWDGYFGGLFPMFDRDKTTGLWTARDRKLHGAWLATGKVKVKRQKDSQRRRK